MAFVVFEGLDGSGKSTLISGFVEVLKEQVLEPNGLRLVTTREPGGTPVSEAIREILLDKSRGEVPAPLTELLLYEAARAQNVANVILPAIRDRAWVISDRFSPSTVAFQAYARGLARSTVEHLNAIAEQGARADLIVLVDLPPEVSRARLASRTNAAPDRMESEREEFHERVRAGYLKQAADDPNRWLVLDGLLKPDELLKSLLADQRLQSLMQIVKAQP